jgi:cytochrome c
MLRIVLTILALATALPAAAEDCTFASPDEAKAMVERAAQRIADVGAQAALHEFMDPGGEFLDRDLYVFVLDFEGNVWAHGLRPDVVGSNGLEAQSADGRYYVLEMIELAGNAGQGWVEYEFVNACTGEFAPKVSYVKRVGDLIVGVGAYGTVST